MCRLIAYLGKPLIADELLFKPSNSLIKQSMHAQESDIILNGDGFGLGWYAHEIDYTPAVFRSILPAWNDRNLQYLSEKIRSNCILGHVRAANSGQVSMANCHPFHYQRFLFMHNGSIGGFKYIKRHLRRALDDKFYNFIQGQTDSEHLFALFLQVFNDRNGDYTATGFEVVLKETLNRLFELSEQQKIEEPHYLNLVITNGLSMIACRVSNDKARASSLHYTVGSSYQSHEGVCHMTPAVDENEAEAIIVASEKLNQFNAEWQDIPVNHILLIHQSLQTKIHPL